MAERGDERSTLGAVIGSIVLAAACAVGGWIAHGMWLRFVVARGVEESMAQDDKAKAPQPTVAVTNAEMRVYNLPEQFVAHAEAVQEVDLLPQVDGYVKEIKFKEGDLVNEGEVLYVIDDERYRAVVNQRRADLAAAEAEARRAERYYERMQKADERGITQLERDNAEAAAEKAKAAVMQANANLVVAEYDLKKTTVVAPFSGQIGKSSAHLGDYVAPSKGALAKIVQVDPIRVSFPLTDRAYISWRMSKKDGANEAFRMRLILPNGKEYDREGSWDFDDSQMSRETASIIMRLKFPNPERLLVPNSYVTLLTDFQNPPSYPSVPQQALIDLPGGNQGVWVVKKDGTAEPRAVKTRDAYLGWSPITEGLEAGETVVISGVSKLMAGAKVAVVAPTPNEDIAPKGE